ncbi:ribosomal RNA small subunit methyltransferase H [Bacteroides sp. CAG:927]|jgi:S-adenosyl-methyltransferase mraW|nr:ribosomal RNA small subunit methyltransferase H [Bacteroides sp. CAG:927]
MESEVYHIPALLSETIEALQVRPDGVYVDATFGGGGHSMAIMERLSLSGHLYSFDQDDEAVSRAPKDERFTIVYSNFRFLRNFMRYYGVESVDGVLGDLGVSFHHFDAAERGFSFRQDAPLDMRMNRHGARTAADLLATLSEEELANVLYLYGELKQSRRMASAIVKSREAGKPVHTTGELLELIKPMINPRQEKKELAMVFQALRIAVNGELTALEEFLMQACELLKPGGRLAIITYHSLEDRLVKNFMRSGNIRGEVEKDFFGRSASPLKMLGSKPIVPSAEEVERNPRSRSAKLRVAVKL